MNLKKNYLFVVYSMILFIMAYLLADVIGMITGIQPHIDVILKDFTSLVYITLGIFAAYISMLFVLSNLKTAHRMPIYKLCIEYYHIQYYIVALLISVLYFYTAKQITTSALVFYISSILVVVHVYVFITILHGVVSISLSYPRYRRVLLEQVGNTLKGINRRNNENTIIANAIDKLEHEYSHIVNIVYVHNTHVMLKSYCTGNEQSIDPRKLHSVLKSLLTRTEALCKENEIKLVKFVSPDKKVARGKPVFGLFSERASEIPSDLDEVMQEHTAKLETDYITVEEEYSNATFNLLDYIKEAIRNGDREALEKSVNTVIDTYMYAISPYVEEKLAKEIRSVIKVAVEENRHREINEILNKSILLMLIEAQENGNNILYRKIIIGIVSMLDIMNYNDAMRELYRGIIYIINNTISYEYPIASDTVFMVENNVRHLYTILMYNMMNNRKQYSWQIERAIKENTPEYSIRNREIIVEKVYKYSILALARVISQQVHTPNVAEFEENIEHVIQNMIGAIDTYEDLEVNNALEIIESNTEQWTWDIELGLRRIDLGEVMSDSGIDVECLIVALALLIKRDHVSKHYVLTQEYSMIRSSLRRENLDRILLWVGEELREIVDELVQKIETAPGRVYQAVSGRAPINMELAQKALAKLDQLQDINKLTIRNSRPPITVFLAETDEITVLFQKRYPRAAFQEADYRNYYFKYEDVISKDINRYIWQAVIECYHHTGTEIDLIEVISTSQPILGFNTKEFQRRLLLRRNDRDQLVYETGEWKIDVISNSGIYIYDIAFDSDSLQLNEISYESAREELARNPQGYFMYGEIDLNNREIVKNLVVELCLRIDIEMAVGDKSYHRMIGTDDDEKLNLAKGTLLAFHSVRKTN